MISLKQVPPFLLSVLKHVNTPLVFSTNTKSYFLTCNHIVRFSEFILPAHFQHIYTLYRTSLTMKNEELLCK